MKTCLQSVPSSIEEHGSEWPEEWPKRLETFPDWVNNKEKLSSDTEHWKAIVDKSYLTGFGIDWSNIRNIMDMKAIYGGYGAFNFFGSDVFLFQVFLLEVSFAFLYYLFFNLSIIYI